MKVVSIYHKTKTIARKEIVRQHCISYNKIRKKKTAPYANNSKHPRYQ